MMDFRCTFLVVTSGKPSARSKRIWWPKIDRVPVPVRSRFSTPVSRTSSSRSRYCFIFWAIPAGLQFLTPSAYIVKVIRVRPGDYGDKRLCNKRLGPGGSTRRLHHKPTFQEWVFVGAKQDR